MPFTLTTAQRNELQALRNTFPATDSPAYSQSLNYYAMYEKVFSYINSYEATGNILTDDERITKIWLKGVIGVNQGVGVQSDFIRDYNSTQKELRYGESLTQAQLDKASDDIALLVINTILSTSQLPNISVLAGHDVAVVSAEYLNNDTAAWAGNPLLLALGYDGAFNANIINASGPTYELLSVIKVSDQIMGGFTAVFDFDS